MNKTNQNKIVSAMKNSKGRFFGLTVKNGDRINAQFSYETPQTVVIYDRNRYTHRRLNKSSLARLSMGQVQVG
jgi:hypothetical protein